MPSASQTRALHKVFHPETIAVEAGKSEVIDVRGLGGFAVYSDGGTATAQPCEEDGTPLPGASAASVTLGDRNDVGAHFYKIAAATEDALVVLLG